MVLSRAFALLLERMMIHGAADVDVRSSIRCFISVKSSHSSCACTSISLSFH